MPSTRVTRALILGVGAAVGVFVVAVAYDWEQALGWVPDLVTGTAWFAVAAVAWPTRRATAWLAAGAALAWFAGTILPFGLYWHRALILHLLLAFPASWPRRVLLAVAVVGAYAASVTPYVWSAALPAFLLAAAIAAVAVDALVRPSGPSTASSRTGLWSTLGYAAVICATSILMWTVPGGRAANLGYLAYCAVLIAIAIALMQATRSPDREALSDLVVQVATDEARVDAARLGDVLGDPTVRIGYWRDDLEKYVDDDGVVQPTGDQASTRVDQDGRPLALITHDRALSADPVLLETATQAVQWSVTHRRLHGEIEAHITDIRASRRRLRAAADDELSALRRELADQVIRPLDTVAAALARSQPDSRDAAPARALRVQALLAHALDELDTISQGLAPQELDGGLEAALDERARRATIPVTISQSAPRLPHDIEVAIYYVCAEAITNAAKHAPASQISIEVSSDGDDAVLAIEDDGPGGADPALGSGLRGLADRVESLGGSLRVSSPIDGGTAMIVRLPLRE